MRITVNDARCQGHARCVYFAPEVFELDDEGYSKVRPGFETVPVELEGKVRKACANCPELAIVVTE
jgi:ferredoxin